ncbi:hypothetical protein [Hymenobacter latericus]|uniref:hypothetical protein n=1 Tax=Hymenobacter sp. YIM 151858-1 TaxID=2987688 RepID=UPI002227A8AA|nr:hypothetical protein [Hymenobacter sp. YIM 151858-1]UYZ59548.1 hypothetical protein OIS50_01820 [Hymenobacter sp. YIM 151858-1]
MKKSFENYAIQVYSVVGGLLSAVWMLLVVWEVLVRVLPRFAEWANEVGQTFMQHHWRWEEAVLYGGLAAIVYHRFHKAWESFLRWLWGKVRRRASHVAEEKSL